ncbi:MAG: hypothetical protein Aureis2KO_00550 [Aureisphaera sp.]
MKRNLLILITSLITSITSAQYFELDNNAGDLVNTALHQAGGTWMDYNNDGMVDIVVMGYDNPAQNRTRIYENNAGVFTASGTSDFYIVGTGGPTSVAGDFDNDGDLDLYQINYQENNGNDPSANILYENTGAPDYEFIATTLVGGPGEENYSSTGTWVDYDMDGDLDLFSTGGNGTTDIFYRNDNGVFTSVTDLSFLMSRFWAITTDTWFDFDGDGDLDVYFTNFSNQDNKLYLSQFVETGDPDNFVELSIPEVTNNAGTNIGCNWVDYDNDRDLDLFLNYFNNQDRLYRNNGDGTFTEINDQPMTQNSGWTTVNSWADFDNDGDLDLYQNTRTNSTFPGFLYENNGSGEFTSVESAIAGDITNTVVSPQGGGWADYDNDGDLDLVVITCCTTFPSGAAVANDLFENKIGQDNNFAKISLQGVASNTNGIGAEIHVSATINGSSVWQTRRINGGVESFGMQEQQIAHFGLGDATVIDSLIVKWPSGLTEVCTDVASGDIQIMEGSCDELGITDISPAEGIRIYPNPTSEELHIKSVSSLLISNWEIIAMDGKIVKTSSSYTGGIDVSELTEGIYFLSVTVNGQNKVVRFIKE